MKPEVEAAVAELLRLKQKLLVGDRGQVAKP